MTSIKLTDPKTGEAIYFNHIIAFWEKSDRKGKSLYSMVMTQVGNFAVKETAVQIDQKMREANG